jgi:hypothetical protein
VGNVPLCGESSTSGVVPGCCDTMLTGRGNAGQAGGTDQLLKAVVDQFQGCMHRQSVRNLGRPA